MKQKLFTTAIVLLLTTAGCVSVRVTMGMSETEFTHKYKTAEIVTMSQQGDIYRMLLYSNGRQVYKFFYFSNGKLVQMDEGIRPADIVIQNTN